LAVVAALAAASRARRSASVSGWLTEASERFIGGFSGSSA
jgi:hypothetical protein